MREGRGRVKLVAVCLALCAAAVSVRSAGAEPVTVVLHLAPGCNLVSWNVDTANDSISAIVRPIKAHLKAVYGYETSVLHPSGGAVGAKLYNPTFPIVNNSLKLTDHRLAYVFYMTVADTLAVTGTAVVPNAEIPLAAGFNLIGYLPSFAGTTQSATSSIQASLSLITGFETSLLALNPAVSGGTMYLPSVDPRFNTLRLMGPTMGYWIKMTAAGTLTYPALPTQ